MQATRFFTLEINISDNDEEPMKNIMENINRYAQQIAGSVVRLLVRIPKRLEGRIVESEISRALSSAYYLTVGRQVIDESREVFVPRGIEELGPVEALEKYLEIKNIPPERRKILLEYGYNLIKEVIESDK